MEVLEKASVQLALVTGVLPDSIAAELGFEPGDRLLTVNGQRPRDLIDYRILCAEEELALEVLDGTGHTHQLSIEKEIDEDLGLEFSAALFDGLIQCNNRCPFCFIDQQPPYLRETLHLKDDDYRLSFLYGSYLTLTNLSAAEWERIAKLRLSPLFVSVHATEPDLRAQLLKNARAGLILEQLEWFRSHGLQLHAQVVLCPQLNDGIHLERTLTDLARFYGNGDIPTVISTAVVPVGLTRFRPEEDDSLRPVTAEEARTVIRQVSNLQKRFLKELGTRFVWLSDEWYLLAGCKLPGVRHYEDYAQLGNGVGSLRRFLSEFDRAAHRLPASVSPPCRYSWVVGTAVEQCFAPVIERLNRVEGLTVELQAIPSRFWGQQITVTGLLTGSDLLDGLKGRDLGDGLLLPSLMLREGKVFLDGVSMEALSCQLETPILPIDGGAQALVDTLLEGINCQQQSQVPVPPISAT